MGRKLFISTFLSCGLVLLLGSSVSADYRPGQGTEQADPLSGSRPWDLSIRAFTGYNDNVPMVPYVTFFKQQTEFAKKGGYGGLSVDGNYRFIQNEEFLVGAGLTFDQVFYGNNVGPACCSTDPPDYNLTAVSPTMFGRYNFGFILPGRWVVPASVGVAYSYRQDWLPITGAGHVWHTKIHTMQLDMLADLTRQFKVGVNYSLGFSEFNPTQATSARDARSHGVGTSGTYSFRGGLQAVTLGYQYGTSDAAGSNFRSEGSHGIKAKFKSQIYGPVWGAVDVGITWEDYKGFSAGFIPPPGRKWQRTESYGAQLYYVITPNIQLDLFYQSTGWNSNQRQFEAHRNNGGAGVTYRF